MISREIPYNMHSLFRRIRLDLMPDELYMKSVYDFARHDDFEMICFIGDYFERKLKIYNA